MPTRIQRKRTKGWRMPENTVYVGRPSRWGNPFSLERGLISLRADNGQQWIEGGGDIDTLIAVYRQRLVKSIKLGRTDLSPLRGKNLACWCAIGQPCHADVLLDLANAGLSDE